MWIFCILFIIVSAWEEPNPTSICVPCEPGYHSTVNCSHLASAPVNCSSGFCEIDVNCTECEPGFAQPLDRQFECEACGPGYWSDEPASTNCQFCFRGFFCPHPNNTEMIPCPIGHYCPATRSVAPSLCPAGYYCPSKELQNPLVCPGGKFCVEGCISPADCPPDTRCPPGSSAPSLCPSLFRSNGLSESCSPDAGFWSIIGVTGAVIMALCVWVFLRRNANKPPRLDEQATDTEAPTDQEAYGLIPKSKGPSYSGF